MKRIGALSRKVSRPSADELELLVKTYSFVHIGKLYNVSDNAVRKWCVSYGIPHKKIKTVNITKSDIVKCMHDGITFTSVAKMYRITPDRLSTLVKQYNIVYRSSKSGKTFPSR